MKKLLWAFLFLTLPVLADPAPFGAKFARPYTKEKSEEGVIYLYRFGIPEQSQVIVVLNKQQTLSSLKDFTVKNMPSTMGRYEEKSVRLSNHPAIQLDGINKHGVPFSLLLVNIKGKSVMAGSATYDMAVNREFINSLKL